MPLLGPNLESLLYETEVYTIQDSHAPALRSAILSAGLEPGQLCDRLERPGTAENTTLHDLAFCGHTRLIQCFFSFLIPNEIVQLLQIKNGTGSIPLDLAVVNKRIDIIELMLTAVPNYRRLAILSIQKRYGGTPLHTAVTKMFREGIECMMESLGLTAQRKLLDEKNRMGFTALDLARNGNHTTEIAECLEQYVMPTVDNALSEEQAVRYNMLEDLTARQANTIEGLMEQLNETLHHNETLTGRVEQQESTTADLQQQINNLSTELAGLTAQQQDFHESHQQEWDVSLIEIQTQATNLHEQFKIKLDEMSCCLSEMNETQLTVSGIIVEQQECEHVELVSRIEECRKSLDVINVTQTLLVAAFKRHQCGTGAQAELTREMNMVKVTIDLVACACSEVSKRQNMVGRRLHDTEKKQSELTDQVAELAIPEGNAALNEDVSSSSDEEAE